MPPPPPPSAGATETVPEALRGMTAFLAVGMVGVVLMLSGLAWDAISHARDLDAAHAERNIFALSSISHLLLLLGGGLAVGSLTAATARALSLSGGRRLASPLASGALITAVLVLVAATAGSLVWASHAEDAAGSVPFKAPESHGIGIVNSHEDAPCRPTKAQRAGAEKLVTDTRAGTAKYASLAAALADGYVGPATPASTDHYSSITAVQDGKILDPSRPESLMYTLTQRGPVLVGVMYLMNIPGEFGPEPGGCLTRWHIHANVCFANATFKPTAELGPGELCPDGSFRYIPPPALHVWFVDVPGGPFAPEVKPDHLERTVGP